jgi:hypothetical protein
MRVNEKKKVKKELNLYGKYAVYENKNLDILRTANN